MDDQKSYIAINFIFRGWFNSENISTGKSSKVLIMKIAPPDNLYSELVFLFFKSGKPLSSQAYFTISLRETITTNGNWKTLKNA